MSNFLLDEYFCRGEELLKNVRRVFAKYEDLNLQGIEIAKLPQSSFDKFAEDVEKIKYPYTIDFQNPNNTVITKDKKIILTDDLLQYNKYCGANSTAKLLRIFMLDASLNVYTPVFHEHLNEARALFKKIILAGEKAGLTLSDGNEDKILISDALYKCQTKVKGEDFLMKISSISLNLTKV